MKALPTLAALLLTSITAPAATFEGVEGISMDIWSTWPSEDKWGDANSLLPFPEWKRMLDVEDLRSLTDAGFDFVRIPVDPAPFLSPVAAAHVDRLYDETRDAVDLALKAGLNVIVDIHAIPAGARSVGTSEYLAKPELFEAYLAHLRRMASMLKDRDPKRVALEVFNEPTNDCDSDGTSNWPGQMKQTFAAARASAVNLTLILSGACWGSAEALAKIDPREVADDNILWSFHSYDPFILTHQGATWTGDFEANVTGLPFPLHTAPESERKRLIAESRARLEENAPASKRSGHLAYFDDEIAKIETADGLEAAMEKPFATVANWAKANGIDPANVLLGEFGMIRQEYGRDFEVSAKSRHAYYAAMIAKARAHGFRWAAFSMGGAFGLVYDWDGKVLDSSRHPVLQ